MDALKRAQEAAAALAANIALSGGGTAPTELHQPQEKEIIEIDPLDAFMAAEVLPEVTAKEKEEQKQAAEEKKQLEELLAVRFTSSFCFGGAQLI